MGGVVTTEISTNGFLVVLPFKVNESDNFTVLGDVSAWMDEATISDIAFSATNSAGEAANAVFDEDNSGNSTQSFYVQVVGSATNGTYTIKVVVTDSDGDDKAFFIRFSCGTQ